jgi:T-complex protein 1 subunit eta
VLHQGEIWYGVDVFEEDIADNFVKTVWEPAVVKINAITAAAEACCIVLSVDETVTNPTSKIAGANAQNGGHPGLQMAPGGGPMGGGSMPQR